jgi:hypothetical protein
MTEFPSQEQFRQWLELLAPAMVVASGGAATPVLWRSSFGRMGRPALPFSGTLEVGPRMILRAEVSH